LKSWHDYCLYASGIISGGIKMNGLSRIMLLVLVAVLLSAVQAGAQMHDLEIVHTETKEIKDQHGSIKIRMDWLKRPGEMVMTIDYYGFLTQEGMVNFYINVNGEQREFMTMKQEMKNRAQRIRVLSFHPTIKDKKINRLAELPNDTVVDRLLFRNAPYYKQFGACEIEIIFFAHGRWHGDSENHNENFRLSFLSPIADFSVDHF
jgi:hypothetical protein